MPELSRFYGIILKMIYSDNEQHHKPHFHVYYNGYEATFPLTKSSLCSKGVQPYVYY